MKSKVLLLATFITCHAFNSALAQIDTTLIPALEAKSAFVLPGTITLDGKADETAWQLVDSNSMNYLTGNCDCASGVWNGSNDFSGSWKSLWNEEGLYVLVNVIDDNIVKRIDFPGWLLFRYDMVELFFNPTGKRNASDVSYVANNAVQIRINTGDETDKHQISGNLFGTDITSYNGGITENECQYSIAYSSQGYTLEAFIKWSFVKPDSLNLPIRWGFTINVGDADNGNQRDHVLMWTGINNERDYQWNNVNYFGYLNLMGDIIWASKNNLCSFDEDVTLFFMGNESDITNYEWNFDNAFSIEGSDGGPYSVKWNSSGTKNIRLITTKINGEKDTMNKSITVSPKLTVALRNDFRVCKDESFELAPVYLGGVRPLEFLWNDLFGDSIYVGSMQQSGSIIAKTVDQYGCSASDTVLVTVPEMVPAEQICMVTIDNSTGKNRVLWEKTYKDFIKEYQVLKESTVAGEYIVIGTVPYNNDGSFIDYTSKPEKHTDKYCLITIDSCDNSSPKSDIHETMHLLIMPGLPGKYNLSWTPYTGFEYGTYYLYRGDTPDQMEQIDSFASYKTQYTDEALGTVFYQVAIRKANACNISKLKAGGSVYQEALSNLEDNLLSSVENIQNLKPFSIKPNPFRSTLTVEYRIAAPCELSITLYNLLGTKIYEYHTKKYNQGVFKHIITNQFLYDASTINIVKIEMNRNTWYEKVIKY